MNKQEFLSVLETKLSGLPKNEVDERLNFYSEMIADRMEEGLTEEEAVAQLGEIDEIVPQVIADIPLSVIVKENIKPKQTLKTWEIILIILAAPVWIPLLIALLSVAFALYVVLWSLLLALVAVVFALAVSLIAIVAGAIVSLLRGNALVSMAVLGAGALCAGVVILLVIAVKAATKGIILLTKKIILKIKSAFIRKGDSQ